MQLKRAADEAAAKKATDEAAVKKAADDAVKKAADAAAETEATGVADENAKAAKDVLVEIPDAVVAVVEDGEPCSTASEGEVDGTETTGVADENSNAAKHAVNAAARAARDACDLDSLENGNANAHADEVQHAHASNECSEAERSFGLYGHAKRCNCSNLLESF